MHQGESNRQQVKIYNQFIHGNDPGYHYPIDAVLITNAWQLRFLLSITTPILAQLELQTLHTTGNWEKWEDQNQQ